MSKHSDRHVYIAARCVEVPAHLMRLIDQRLRGSSFRCADTKAQASRVCRSVMRVSCYRCYRPAVREW